MSSSASGFGDSDDLNRHDGNLEFSTPHGHTETLGGILRLISVMGLWAFVFVCALYFKWEERRNQLEIGLATDFDHSSEQQDANAIMLEEELTLRVLSISKFLESTSRVIQEGDIIVDDLESNKRGISKNNDEKDCLTTQKEGSNTKTCFDSGDNETGRSSVAVDEKESGESTLPLVTMSSNMEKAMNKHLDNDHMTILLKLPSVQESSSNNKSQEWQSENNEPHFVSAQCAICLLPYETGDEVTWSPNIAECRHAFHKACISSWLVRQKQTETQNPKCPCCRNEFYKLPQG